MERDSISVLKSAAIRAPSVVKLPKGGGDQTGAASAESQSPSGTRRIRGVILDLDGTVYRGDALIPGAAAAISALKRRGVGVVYATNKSLDTEAAYAAKLTRLGVPTEPEDVIGPIHVLVDWLKREAPGARLFIIGEAPLAAALAEAGFSATDDPVCVDVVVVAADRTFDYRKLTIALRAIQRGARCVATNPDHILPVADGDLPDCGAMIGAVEGCTGRRVDAVMGKPGARMLTAALARLGVVPGECLVVGDRIDTDIRMGRLGGTSTALVSTGVTRSDGPTGLAQTLDLTPDYVVDSIRDLPAMLSHNRPPRVSLVSTDRLPTAVSRPLRRARRKSA